MKLINIPEELLNNAQIYKHKTKNKYCIETGEPLLTTGDVPIDMQLWGVWCTTKEETETWGVKAYKRGDPLTRWGFKENYEVVGKLIGGKIKWY